MCLRIKKRNSNAVLELPMVNLLLYFCLFFILCYTVYR